MTVTLESELEGINDIFLSHQINSLKLSDQRTFLDSLSYSDKKVPFHIGDMIAYNGVTYWVEEIDKDFLLLKNPKQSTFKSKTDPKLKKLNSHRLITLAEERFKALDKGDVLKDDWVELFLLSHELKYNDSKRFASVKGSKIQILPHQINAVYQILNSLNHRFLLADEVGLGKTIETGLLIKEFIMRYHYEKILVIVPAPLTGQWQMELREKFNENFTILDSRSLRKIGKGDIKVFIKKHKKILVSLDFAKQNSMYPELCKNIWDMVIFDEAHRLRRDRGKITQAYKFADEISYRTKSFFLLSATPFSGKLEELYFFMSLLARNKMGSLHSFTERYYNEGGEFLNKLIGDVTIRRTKKDVGGFTRRNAATIKYRLNHLEKSFYELMSDFVRREYNKALESRSNCRALMLTFFQKMMDSSLEAIQNAIEKRIGVLEEKVSKLETNTQHLKQTYQESLASLQVEIDDEEGNIEDILSTQNQSAKDIKSELFLLKDIYKHSTYINVNSKAQKLKALIKKLTKENPREKIIIFTQFKTTMFSLEKMLHEYSPIVFHGSMNREEKDLAVEAFRRDKQIFIATEAGGEGRNLQFSRMLINYDLPWNPFKVEQRIGRIHRFGQKKDVHIFNFAMEESIGERIIEILTDKIQVFEDAFGETEAVLGMIEGGMTSFEDIIMKFQGDKEKLDKALEQKIKISKEKMKKLAIANHYFNSPPKSSINDIKKEVKKISNKLKDFFELYAKVYAEDIKIRQEIQVNGTKVYKVKSHDGLTRFDHVTFDYSLIKKYQENEIDDEWPKEVEYLHIEHPLIKMMLNKKYTNSISNAVSINSPRPKKAVMSYIVSFNYYNCEEKSIQVEVPFDEVFSNMYMAMNKAIEKRIEKEKQLIISNNKKLIEVELTKVKENYDKQIKDLEYVLETYEFKNQQSNKDNYFLLIPKVKKQLKNLKLESKEVIDMTKEKLNVKTEAYPYCLQLF